ncbi:hypothetical protein SARC_17643, partial [Sphaeroforma arctica JP610]
MSAPYTGYRLPRLATSDNALQRIGWIMNPCACCWAVRCGYSTRTGHSEHSVGWPRDDSGGTTREKQ